ncbi:hypothetical protein A3K34_00380 [candidate division WWE3 bacterium RIFOXYC1_FULL_40_10]|uniref:dTDP-4-dehydrorhamnose 3,5-epimerase n=1 Tax=candidate division WWE3 bacterium RIFOXYA2_FULL_46_9 TaxID=1802636 RepID=A0A1F4W1G5_UNCKA|nr:MAG: hypothetical protein A3K58_00380 [candidate division WWE3 bacterium RIFOXYB1_FULL_40_22]OGC61344.1 MAG: hypothetical protein A3K37_00380 [candidate division WWE3 bacterium RIFOXYA1_FULL_40_11]OGC63254.1 MAG: hypothetical protein A2264_01040 [candidate division WWE3 bacterium RIFOXYA2_FULL_46_9]OGC65334.1 MAG: hypothetical protein A2326_04665 [candidate division WWE3 bacterium RIFOXYB2_FULL_41_6]OGC65727.1 MAG: hypothetical protein A3K34_00380 [candidate division WWE3 bacterium RIFOXYC1_
MFDISSQELKLPKVRLISFKRFIDERGFFTEPYRESDIRNLGEGFENFKVVQVNESRSPGNIIRGLHFQWNPYMGKLVRPLQGTLFEVLLDIRKDSPTFGKTIIVKISRNVKDEFDNWLWSPPGIAHGFFCLEETVMEYLCTGEYTKKFEATINPLSEDIDWSLADPELYDIYKGVLGNQPILSERDLAGYSVKGWSESPDSDNFLFANL